VSDLWRGSRVKVWIGVIVTLVIIVLVAVMLRSSLDEAKNPSSSGESSTRNSMVEDPVILAWIWDEYIQDAIPTIFNNPFKSAEEINRDDAIHYAVYVIIRHQAYQEIEPGWGRIEPELVSQYIKKYLSVDITNIHPAQDYAYTAYYDSSKDAFDIKGIHSSYPHVKFNELTPWCSKLDSVTKNEEDRTYQVKLVQFASGKSSRINGEINCVLKERTDGSMYFKQVSYRYPDQKQLVSIQGKYRNIDLPKLKINAENKDRPFMVIAEFNNRLFIRYNDGRQGIEQREDIGIYDVSNLKELMQVKSAKQIFKVKQTQDGYMLIASDSIIYLDKDLQNQKELRLPDTVREAYQFEWQGGFDVSKNGRYFVYSSKNKGLMLYDAETKSEKLLANHYPENRRFNYIPYIYGPVLVDHDHKVVANISGYEGLEGYLMADLNTLELRKITNAEFINFDSALPAAYGIYPHTEQPNGTGKSTVGVARLDYSKMEVSKSGVLISDDVQRDLLNGEEGAFSAYNDRYLVYITLQYSQTDDPAENIYHLIRINLDSMQAETILTIKGGYPSILGILDNGQVIFSYWFENENGIGITDRANANE
jgi:hypothetical protein